MKRFFVFLFLVCSVVCRADEAGEARELAAARWLTGRSDAFFYGDSVRGRLGVEGTALTMRDVRDVTNTPAFLVWLAAQPGPTPSQFPDGIEAPLMILTSQTNGWGIGIMAADDGTLLTYTDHQSPRPAATQTARRQAAALSAHTNKVAGRAVQRANSRKPNITQAEKINVLWETYKLEHP